MIKAAHKGKKKIKHWHFVREKWRDYFEKAGLVYDSLRKVILFFHDWSIPGLHRWEREKGGLIQGEAGCGSQYLLPAVVGSVKIS